MENLLELKNVSKHYDHFQLKDVNLELPSGCIMGLIGENGAGKSTLMKLILNLAQRDSGTVTVLGEPAEVFSKKKNEAIGVVMDESNFPEVLNRLEINKILRSVYRNWEEDTFQQYCQTMQLPEKKPIKEYSRGMKMKLSIASALSHKARLLLLDEATSGLDPVVREEILDLFLEFIQNEACSVLMSSHIVTDLEKVCDYITYLHQGQILFTQPKDILREQYGILRCDRAELNQVVPEALVRVRYHQFGAEALVRKELIRGAKVLDPASIEDIMIFYSRGEAFQC